MFWSLPQRECPLCKGTFAYLPTHLRKRHCVENKTELKLLLRLASARFRGSLECPICEKRLSRLDMHLTGTHKLSGGDLQIALSSAKRGCILDKLAKLRASGPNPPMATTLDLTLELLRDDFQPQTVLVSQPVLSNTDTDCSQEALTCYQIPVTQPPAPSFDWTPPLSSTASPKGKLPKNPTELASSIIGRVLQDFYDYSLRSNPSVKDVENAQLKRNHCIRFLKHMAGSYPDQRFRNLKFLDNFKRLRE